MSKKFYTAGFAFENDKVLLIRKEQPQTGGSEPSTNAYSRSRVSR